METKEKPGPIDPLAYLAKIMDIGYLLGHGEIEEAERIVNWVTAFYHAARMVRNSVRSKWWAMDTIDNQFIHDLIDAALGPGASEYEHRLMFNGAKLAWGIRELEQLPREMAMAKAREIGRGK